MASVKPAIAILSDFGYRDHYAGVMKGVIKTIAPAAAVIDITHGIPPQAVAAGAIALKQSWRYFPTNSVFLAVVDPKVGTARRAIAIETTAGARFVGPDNGLLCLAAQDAGFARAVELRSEQHRLSPVSSTFHGRDVFAPAAAHLWNGVPLSALGPPLAHIEQLALSSPRVSKEEIKGAVVYVDGYGNLVTNVGRESLARLEACFPGRGLFVRIGKGAGIKIVGAYAHVAKGAALATLGSFGLLEIAVRDRSAAEFFAAGEGTPIVVTPRDTPADVQT